MTKKPHLRIWRTRRFVSLLILFSFLASLFTGVVCYIKPTGRVANWTGWTFLGMPKTNWEEIHATTSLLMILLAVLHIWFNWKPLKLYLKGAVSRLREGKLEFIMAAGLLTLTWVGTARGWQPFVQLAHWNGDIKAWWEEHSAKAPRPHAEDSTLATVAGDYGITTGEFMTKLRDAGFEPRGENEILGNLAARHDLSAAAVIAKALGEAPQKKQQRGQRGDGNLRGGGNEDHPQGSGYGRMTLADLCKQEGIDPALALKNLAARGINVAATTRIRTLAGKLGIHPREVAAQLKK